MTERQLLPEIGGWVMLTKSPPVELPIAPLSIYYALPIKTVPKGYFQHGFGFSDEDRQPFSKKELANFGGLQNLWENYAVYQRGEEMKWSEDQKRMLKVLEAQKFEVEQQITIRTIYGDCVINPYEFNIVDVAQYMEQIDGEHLKINMFSGADAGELNQDAKDRIFYMRSRGLSFAEALQFVLPAIDSPNILFLTFHDEYVRMFMRDVEYNGYHHRLTRWNEKQAEIKTGKTKIRALL